MSPLPCPTPSPCHLLPSSPIMHAMKQSGRQTTALRVLTPFAIIAGVELVIFWPLIQRLSTALHDRFDTMLNTWILTWQAHELVRAPLSVFNAPIFHPLPDMLALSEIIWPAAPMTVPILAASGNPLLVYNLTFLGTVFLAAAGMYLLALYVTRNRGAALLAGLFYAFSPYQFGHIPQVQLLSIGWLPLTLLYLDRFWARGRRHDGLHAGALHRSSDPLDVLLRLPGCVGGGPLSACALAAAAETALLAPPGANLALVSPQRPADPALCAALFARAQPNWGWSVHWLKPRTPAPP